MRSDVIVYGRVVELPDYSAARHAVEMLGEERFPVENLRIVGIGVESVEQVTGRTTLASEIAKHAATGGWLGLFTGLMFAFFTMATPSKVIVAGTMIGAAFGAVRGAVGRLGGKPFDSVVATRSCSYELQAVSGLVEEAKRILRV